MAIYFSKGKTEITFSEIKLSSTPPFDVAVRDKAAEAKGHFHISIYVPSRQQEDETLSRRT